MVGVIRMRQISGYGNSVEGKTTSVECIRREVECRRREDFLQEVAIALGLRIQINE